MFEKLTDVVWTWELETTNIIMLKKYPEKPLLNVVVRILSISFFFFVSFHFFFFSFLSTFQQILEEFPRMTGVMYFENKKIKWTKRYFEFKLSGMYHYKDTKVCYLYKCWHLVWVFKKTPSLLAADSRDLLVQLERL